MGTLKETSYSLANKLGKPNDFGFLGVLEFDILSLTALLARREYEKTRKFPNELVTKLSCIPVSEVDSAECCDVELGCKVLRTAVRIPSTINVKDNTNFISVTALDIKTKVPYINPARIGFTDSKFGNFGFYTIMNGYVYIFQNKRIEYINIIAAFVDIRKLADVKDCAGISCFDSSNEVTIPDHYIPTIMEDIQRKYSQLYQKQEVEISKDV